MEETPLLPAPASRPPGLLGSFNELLVQPLAPVERARRGKAPMPLGLLVGSLVVLALYGAAAGFFQGGWQILVAALKVPLIVALTLLLCAPSLYVFGALAGARWSARTFWTVVACFAAILALLLAALLPIAWLFSVSSRYLASMVWLHVALWLLALALAWRFLRRALTEVGARAMLPWLLLFALVSLQAATFLRPILWREPGAPLFRAGEKMFFLEHLGAAFDHDEAVEKKAKEEEKNRKTAAQPAKTKPATPAPAAGAEGSKQE